MPDLKGRLSKELIKFLRIGFESNKSYVMGVIGSPEDRYLVEKSATDICVVMLNYFCCKRLKIEGDLTLTEFYGLTYLLFKHGSQLHRKLIVAARFYFKKSIFFFMLFISFYLISGWSITNYIGTTQLCLYFPIIF